MLKRSLLVSTLLITACAKHEAPPSAAQPAAPAAQAAANPQVDPNDKSPITLVMNQDIEKIGLIEAMAPVSDAEERALTVAKEKISIVKAGQANAEQTKQTAFEAKAAYTARVKEYQRAQGQADEARQARVKATAALADANKEFDAATNAFNNAYENRMKTYQDPSHTDAQIAAADAALMKAKARVEQASSLVNARQAEVDAQQRNNQSVLSTTVTNAGEIATQAGADYAQKATIAVKAVAFVNAALAEERKAMAVIFTLNQARAKVVADNLANAALSMAKTRSAAENARDEAKRAANAKAAAQNRVASANQEEANARVAASNAAQASAQAAAVAQAKADAKATADAEAARAQSIYNDAKAVLDAAAAVSNKSAAEARLAAKTLADANAKVAATAKALAAATEALQKANDPAKKVVADVTAARPGQKPAPVKPAAPARAPVDPAKFLADAQLAASQALQAQADAKAAAESVNSRAARDAAVTAQAKTDADAKLAVLRQVNSVAAAAARDKATADATADAAVKASARADAASADRHAAADKAAAALAAAESANAAAANRAATATQNAGDARSTYDRLFTQNEVYQLSPTKTEQEEQAEDQKLFAAALWAKVPEGNYWTTLVVASIRQNLSRLEKAKDINTWCPGYADADDHQRAVCWLRLLGGVIKFESEFKPDDAFEESPNHWSVGLMALSPNECQGYETVTLLKQPLLNLSCGISKFAALVEKDGYILGSDDRLGAAAYWSTLRAPYTKRKPGGDGVFRLGKRDQILPLTREYRKY